MSEAESKAINIPWAPLLALLAAVAGLTTLLPSRSSRPPATGAEVTLAGKRGVSARLWQDPLQVAEEAETRRKKDPASEHPNDWSWLQAEYNELKGPLVLMICEPDSPYAEDVERRLRDRAAIHYALSAEGYVPRQSTALNYLVDEGGDPVPFESFVPISGTRQQPQKVLVIWVGDGLLEGKPMEKFAGVIGHLMPQGSLVPVPEVRILGPSTSGEYRKILEELKSPPSEETKRLLASTQVYSCKATAAEKVLGEGADWLKPGELTAHAIEEALRNGGCSNFSFERTIAKDDELYTVLINELEQRHIKPDASIVVLSQMDSLYGRALAGTFRESIDSAAATKGALKNHIHAYTYMAGIDGALPKTALGIEEHSEKNQVTGKEGDGSIREATEGQSQIDYFRRLADLLAVKNDQLIRERRDGFRVVAVLGSDIYDKLQILRILRPRLPGALFITNELDGRFAHPDEWDETRNLLVAASYPLKVDWQGDETPPFRDSTQVSVYSAARHALKPVDNHPDKNWKGKSQLFEIGRRGPVELKVDAVKGGLPLRPITAALLALLLLALLTFLLLRGTAGNPLNPAHGWLGFASRSFIAVPAAVVASLGITAWRYRSQTGSIEPFALYDGISIWPGDFVRLFVLLLAVHFVFKTLVGLEKNARTLAEDFELKRDSKPPAQVNAWLAVLARWKTIWPHMEPASSTRRVSVQELVNRYTPLGRPISRCLRALMLLAIYFALIVSIFQVFPSTQPYLPVRGNAYFWSLVILMLSVISTLYVTFLVVDAITLNCWFIRNLNRGRSDWPLSVDPLAPTKFKFASHMAVLETEDFADYLDIQCIARRSNALNALVYYPFILIALLVAARWSQTDGYPWPTMLIVVFILNASWAVYCAVRLPIEARAARETSLRRLRDKLFERRANEAINPDDTKSDRSNSVALEAVIVEIEKLRQGAFAGIWEQPLLRAILLPSGGVGLWALWDLLPR
jgi:hypothetical protein